MAKLPYEYVPQSQEEFDQWISDNFLDCPKCEVVGVIERFPNGKCPKCARPAIPLSQARIQEIIPESMTLIFT